MSEMGSDFSKFSKPTPARMLRSVVTESHQMDIVRGKLEAGNEVEQMGSSNEPSSVSSLTNISELSDIGYGDTMHREKILDEKIEQLAAEQQDTGAIYELLHSMATEVDELRGYVC
jgi:hypothetical protein